MKPNYNGKVRDIYEINGDLMMVASDRISAYDVILKSLIPKKGVVLTQLTLFNLNHFSELLKKYDIKNPVIDRPVPEEHKNRAMFVKKCKPLPIEAIVRGYLFGSAFNEYTSSNQIAAQPVKPGLFLASRLDDPLFTPSTKAEFGGRDVNISFDEMAKLCGYEISNRIKNFCIELYVEASKYTLERGIILCDTKLEFGSLNGELYLIDEVLTPDSSRFWLETSYEIGTSPPSYDKQFVRDYLTKNGLKGNEDVELPQEIIDKTIEKYIDCYERLTGSKFAF